MLLTSLLDVLALGLGALAYTILPHVSTADLATAADQNSLLDDVGVLKTGISDDGSLKGYTETQQSPVAIVSGVVTIDASAGNHVPISLNAAITSFTVTNLPASAHVLALILYFTADGTPRSVTWAVNTHTVRFPGNVTPTMTSTNGKIDRILLTNRDGGTTWFADILGQNY